MPKNSLVYGLPILVWVARSRGVGPKSKKAIAAKMGVLQAPWSRLCFEPFRLMRRPLCTRGEATQTTRFLAR